MHLTHEGSRLVYTRKNTRTLLSSLERRRREYQREREEEEGEEEGNKYKYKNKNKNHYYNYYSQGGKDSSNNNNSFNSNRRCDLRSNLFLSQLLLPTTTTTTTVKSDEWLDTAFSFFPSKDKLFYSTFGTGKNNVTASKTSDLTALRGPSSSYVTTGSGAVSSAKVSSKESLRTPGLGCDIKFSSALLLNTIKRTTHLLKLELSQLNEMAEKEKEKEKKEKEKEMRQEEEVRTAASTAVASSSGIRTRGHWKGINSSHCITSSTRSFPGQSESEDMKAIQYVIATRKDVSEKMIKLHCKSTTVDL